MVGTCNLCKKTKNLQRICHIIPEFFYRENNLYHRFHNLVSMELKPYLIKGKKNIISNKQKQGEYDEYIMCAECDGKVLNKYETYTRNFFYSKSLPKNLELIITDKGSFIECQNADYTCLKLLFISILWRASISKRPMFKEVELDKNIQEEFRVMLLNGNPKKDTEYPIIIMNTFFDDDISRDFIFQPIKMKFGNQNGYMFAFGGMIVDYLIESNDIPNKIFKYRLNENGTFKSLKVPKGETWDLIKGWYTY